MSALVEVGLVLLIATLMLIVGIRVGLLVAPRLGRALDPDPPTEEEPGDRAD